MASQIDLSNEPTISQPESKCNLMNLRFRTLTNKEFSFEVMIHETIGHVKAIIEAQHGFPIDQQCLVWRAVELSVDSMTVAQAGLNSSQVILLCKRG